MFCIWFNLFYLLLGFFINWFIGLAASFAWRPFLVIGHSLSWPDELLSGDPSVQAAPRRRLGKPTNM